MPVKFDKDRRWVELELLLPGTPEQVWHAVATGPGMSAWFTPTRVEERVGGEVLFDFGGGASSKGVVTGWSPPLRVAYEEHGWKGDAPPVLTEIFINARGGQQCVMRMVHSLFTSLDTWDDELEGFEAGWPGFFEVLRLYLRQFPGAPAAVARAMASPAISLEEAYQRLTSGLGLNGANVGQQCRAPSGSPQLGGVVERVQQDSKAREVMLRLEEPTHGVGLVGAWLTGNELRVVVATYLYGDKCQAIAGTLQPELERWLAAEFR